MTTPTSPAPGPPRRRNGVLWTLLSATLALVACTAVVGVEPSAGAPTGSSDATTRPSDPARPSMAPSGSPSPVPASTVAPSRTPIGLLRPAPVASRVVIDEYAIDLAVVSSDLQPPPANYPLCDVAQYLTTYRDPGQKGSTYLYAHARDGMFGALLAASMRRDGAELIGTVVHVYRDDGKRFSYRIVRVQRHATDYSLADDVPSGEQRLILQTSEGPYGTVPKLVIAAELVGSEMVDPAEANPVAQPRDCRPPQLVPAGEPGAGEAAIASRVAVPGLGIDLPVVRGGLQVAGNLAGYPLCDVAQYVERYQQPGVVGTTYLYAHAQAGMFGPLFEASLRDDGRSLVGELVHVYTDTGQQYAYRIFQVKRHATDYRLADETAPDEHRLLLQTSEGANGTVPKLQVVARLVGIDEVGDAEAHPMARPRVCVPPGGFVPSPTPNTGGEPAP